MSSSVTDNNGRILKLPRSAAVSGRSKVKESSAVNLPGVLPWSSCCARDGRTPKQEQRSARYLKTVKPSCHL